jgi:hypothetical protein
VSHVPPTINVQNVSVPANASIPASSMILSVSNPSGDTITAYEFRDDGTGNGHFVVNGVSQPDNQWIEVLTGNLNTIQYVGGVSPGTETLEVEVYDYTTNNYSLPGVVTATTTSPPSTPAGTTADLILQETSGANIGQLLVYDLGNNSILAGYTMGNVGLSWQTLGLGAFAGNPNEADMLMRDSNTGNLDYFDIQASQVVALGAIGNIGLEWQIVGVGDFSSNPNESDMIWRNGNTGALQYFDVQHNQITGLGSIGNVGTEWHTLGAGSPLVLGSPLV